MNNFWLGLLNIDVLYWFLSIILFTTINLYFFNLYLKIFKRLKPSIQSNAIYLVFLLVFAFCLMAPILLHELIVKKIGSTYSPGVFIYITLFSYIILYSIYFYTKYKKISNRRK